jgi:hypothetical protein
MGSPCLAVDLAAACVQVKAIAQLLFEELSKKVGQSSSPIFSLMPDILSNLSNDPSLPAQSFKEIMKLLLRYISKDRQVDALAVRLVARITADQDVKAARVMLFCVQQLKPSLKSIRCLEERVGQFKQFLADEEFSGALRVCMLCRRHVCHT